MTTVHQLPDLAQADTALLLALSDERDAWMRRLLAAERAAYERYERGFNDGRAHACVALAEMEERRESAGRWHEWAAMLRRIIQADTDPSARMNQVMAEIAADQKVMRDARVKRARKPWQLSPLEWQALHHVRLAPLSDREAA